MRIILLGFFSLFVFVLSAQKVLVSDKIKAFGFSKDITTAEVCANEKGDIFYTNGYSNDLYTINNGEEEKLGEMKGIDKAINRNGEQLVQIIKITNLNYAIYLHSESDRSIMYIAPFDLANNKIDFNKKVILLEPQKRIFNANHYDFKLSSNGSYLMVSFIEVSTNIIYYQLLETIDWVISAKGETNTSVLSKDGLFQLANQTITVGATDSGSGFILLKDFTKKVYTAVKLTTIYVEKGQNNSKQISIEPKGKFLTDFALVCDGEKAAIVVFNSNNKSNETSGMQVFDISAGKVEVVLDATFTESEKYQILNNYKGKVSPSLKSSKPLNSMILVGLKYSNKNWYVAAEQHVYYMSQGYPADNPGNISVFEINADNALNKVITFAKEDRMYAGSKKASHFMVNEENFYIVTSNNESQIVIVNYNFETQKMTQKEIDTDEKGKSFQGKMNYDVAFCSKNLFIAPLIHALKGVRMVKVMLE